MIHFAALPALFCADRPYLASRRTYDARVRHRLCITLPPPPCCESVATTTAHLQTVQFGHWHLSLTPCPLDLSYTPLFSDRGTGPHVAAETRQNLDGPLERA